MESIGKNQQDRSDNILDMFSQKTRQELETIIASGQQVPDGRDNKQVPSGSLPHISIAGEAGTDRQTLKLALNKNGIIPDSDKQDEFNQLPGLLREQNQAYEQFVRTSVGAINKYLADPANGGEQPGQQNLRTELSALGTMSSQQVVNFDKINQLNSNSFNERKELAQELNSKGLGNLDPSSDHFNADAQNIIKQPGTDSQGLFQLQLNTVLQTNVELHATESAESQLESSTTAMYKSNSQFHDVVTLDPTCKQFSSKASYLNSEISALKYDKSTFQRGDNFNADLNAIDKSLTDPLVHKKVFDALAEIANAPDGAAPNHLNNLEKTKLVEQLAHQVAHPEDIKQGNRGTCPLSSTEFEEAVSAPGEYARIVADLATTGRAYTTADANGNRTQLSIGPNILASFEGKPYDDHDPLRSLPSRLFQDACTARIGEYRYGAGVKYFDVPPNWKSTTAGKIGASVDGGLFVLSGHSRLQWLGGFPNEEARIKSELTGTPYRVQEIDANTPSAFVSAVEKSGAPLKMGLTLVKGENDFTGMNANAGHALSITGLQFAPDLKDPNTGDPDYFVDFNNTADPPNKHGDRVLLSTLLASIRQSQKSAHLIVKA